MVCATSTREYFRALFGLRPKNWLGQVYHASRGLENFYVIEIDEEFYHVTDCSCFSNALWTKPAGIKSRLLQFYLLKKNMVTFPESTALVSFHLAPKVADGHSFWLVWGMNYKSSIMQWILAQDIATALASLCEAKRGVLVDNLFSDI